VDFYFGDQCHSGEGRATSGEVERTRLIAIASILMDFALVVLEGPQWRVLRLRPEDRFWCFSLVHWPISKGQLRVDLTRSPHVWL
jgi:hypothetical protein